MWTATNSCSDSETRPGAQLMSGREARSSKAAFTHICGLGRPVSMRRQRTNVLRGPAAHLERQAWRVLAFAPQCFQSSPDLVRPGSCVAPARTLHPLLHVSWFMYRRPRPPYL